MGRRIVRTSSQDLKKLLLSPSGGKFFRPVDSFDEVYPGILLGDASTALSTCLLKEIKVTHVLNAAHGKNDQFYGGFVNTSFSNYDAAGIQFMGVPALDTPSFYLRSYFKQAADFIEDALRSNGKVLIHCQCGISRSATLIAAYLMLKKGMDVQTALSTIRSHRSIFPNQGFLSQLCDLEYELKRSANISTIPSSPEPQREKPLKNSYNSSFETDHHRPTFSSSKYPLTYGRTQGSYSLSSPYYDITTKFHPRARSEERVSRSLYDYTRSRSASPPPSSFRSFHATSMMPDTRDYEERPSYGHLMPSSRYVGPRSSYESFPSVGHRNYYYTKTAPESYTYSPRIRARPLTDTYLRTRYLLPEDPHASPLTPRDSTFSSSSPYESYSMFSSYGTRSFSTYQQMDKPLSRLPVTLSSSLRYPALYPATYRHSYLTSLKAC